MAACSPFVLMTFFLLSLAIHPSIIHSRTLKSDELRSFGSIRDLEGMEKGQTVEGLSKVKRHLKAFGYLHGHSLDDPSHDVVDDRFDDSLESALKAYQEYYHHEVTGKLDSDTINGMMMPRCAVADKVHHKNMEHDHGSLGKFHMVARYAFFPKAPRWLPSETTLKYAFTTDGVQVVPLEQLRPIIARAFQRWADVSRFTFQEAVAGEVAQLKIGFYSRNHNDGDPFDGPGYTWAHAFAPRNGRFHYDADEQWSANPSSSQVDLESVAVHEIGHLLGLSHSTDQTAIMYPRLGRGVIKRELQQDDVNGIQALYSSK